MLVNKGLIFKAILVIIFLILSGRAHAEPIMRFHLMCIINTTDIDVGLHRPETNEHIKLGALDYLLIYYDIDKPPGSIYYIPEIGIDADVSNGTKWEYYYIETTPTEDKNCREATIKAIVPSGKTGQYIRMDPMSKESANDWLDKFEQRNQS